VQVVIRTPKKLTAEQERLFRELAGTEHMDVDPHKKGFFDRVRGKFAE